MGTTMTNSADDRLRDASKHRDEFRRLVWSHSSRKSINLSQSFVVSAKSRDLRSCWSWCAHSWCGRQMLRATPPQFWTTSSCYAWSLIALLVVKRLRDVVVRKTVVPTLFVYGQVFPRSRRGHVVKVAPTQISLEAGRGALWAVGVHHDDPCRTPSHHRSYLCANSSL